MEHNLLKRMAPLLILEVLKAHTDEEHGLKIVQIGQLLESEYGLVLERKHIGRCLADLLELSEQPGNSSNWKLPMKFSIKCDVTARKSGEIRDNWRLCKDLEPAQLRLLGDAMLAVPGLDSRDLLEKLGCSQKGRKGEDKRFLIHADALQKAIDGGRKACVLHKGQLLTVSPYRLEFRGSVYRVLCKEGSFPVHTLGDVQVLETAAEPGQIGIVSAVLQMPEDLSEEALCLLGGDVSRSGDGTVTLRTGAEPGELVGFVRRYAPRVRVLAPTALSDRVRQELEAALKAL